MSKTHLTKLSSLLKDSFSEPDVLTFMKDNKDELSKLFKAEKAKRKKDPNAPKKPKPAYIFFCMENRPKLKEENPELKTTQLTSELGAMWKKISDKEKQRFQAMAEEDKVRFETESKSYEPTETDDKPAGKKKKDPSAPKKPRSAYIFFCEDMRETVKKENPDLSGKDILRELGARWKTLTAEDKEQYEEQNKKDKVRYENEKSALTSEDTKKDSKKKETKKEDRSAKEEPKKKEKKEEPKKKDEKKKEEPKKKETKKKETKKESKGFLQYCDDMRAEVEDENPKWTEKQVDKELKKRWDELNDEDKQEYELVAEEDDNDE